MSDIEPGFPTQFFEATRVYDDLRYQAAVHLLGEAAIIQAVDEVPSYEDILNRSEDELARLHAAQDASGRLIEVKLAFDKRAEDIFGNIHGYAPSYIETGLMNLWKNIGGGRTQNLDAASAMNGELVLVKSTSRIGNDGIERTPLTITDEDMVILKEAVECLQRTNRSLQTT